MKLQKGPIHYLILKASLLFYYNKVASVTPPRSVAPHSSLEHIDLPYLLNQQSLSSLSITEKVKSVLQKFLD
jgi:hypothetical protein